ncbi:MAG: hypothetical protein IKR39_11675 [Lachnospiraceae bacterium]|nr:hypothetical protein [Lachnospiraceae bacterium]
MSEARNNRDKVFKIIYIALLAVYAGFLVYLYYNQVAALLDDSGRFESDTVVHIRMAVWDGYYHSLAAFVYLFFTKIFNLGWGLILSVILLAALTVGAIPLTAKLVREALNRSGVSLPDYLVWIISFAGNILIAFYVKAANRAHYIGYQSPNMWHNSTYIFMRFFAILTLLSFLKLYDDYKSGVSLKNWLVFTLLLTVTTGFKASFLTVFAPVLAIVLLRDLCRKTKFINVFVMALSVIPPMAVMVLQSIVMSGTDGSNGYAIKPFAALSMRGDHPKATVILSVLFPLVLLLAHIKDFYKDKYYFWSLVMWAIGFLEVFLFIETGERALDSNFMWGYSIALFFLFVSSMVRLFKDIFVEKTSLIQKIICYVAAAVLVWHVISGINYFCILLSGVTYFA